MFFLLEKFVFFGLIFSLPFQKRIFLFGLPAEASAKAGAEGFFEWSAGFLYFTDFLIFILFVFWLIRCGRSDLPHRLARSYSLSVILAPLMVFLALALVSVTQAELVDVGLYRFGKLAEFIFLFFYTAGYVGYRKSHIRHILWVFVASGLFQSIIAILQFAKQSSLGLGIFHESTLAIGMKGVAEISAGGAEFIRAYGTFPSPNVLAGFLGLCLLFLFYLFLTSPRLFDLPAPLLRREGIIKILSLAIHSAAIFLMLVGLFLTFSRGVIIFFLFVSMLFFFGIFLLKQFEQHRKTALRLLLLFVICSLMIAAFLWPEVSSRFLESSVNEPAIQERIFFNEIGIDTMKQNYMQALFGVGMGNFVHNFMDSVPGLPAHLYQPVHNIFILIASEIGIFGLIAFIIFLAMATKNSFQFFWTRHHSHDRGNDVSIFVLLLVAFFMILIGMYDHYFWTIQQGGLMFWLSLGLLVSATSVHNKA